LDFTKLISSNNKENNFKQYITILINKFQKGSITMSNNPIAQELLNRDDCVLIVIDIQDKLLPQIAHRERLVNNTMKLIKFAKIINIPIIVTEQEKLGFTMPKLMDEMEGIHPIRKIHYSCFGCEEFVEELKKIGRKTLIITGMETHICVLQTALQALPEFKVHVVSDAVSCRFGINWEMGLQRLHDCGVVISTTEMVIFELLRRAGTDEFILALKLVR
jgi:isochorismate hydrolase